MVRLPGVCNFDPATVVLAHLPGGGMGRKVHDIHGAFCCSACHDALDGRVKTDLDKCYLFLCFHQGVVRTQEYWLAKGLIKADGSG